MSKTPVNTDKNLDSKAVVSIHEYEPGVFTVCVRKDYIENLGLYSFNRLINRFDSPRDASVYIKNTYPKAKIVPFDKLTQR